ncbi:MAG: enoyl-CoA hydratase/isomerase family protein [Pseudonocardia sp.]|uniref:enoyl-CoA hydratase/isomerase family protein n=1 Tax=unclassified Pseudonocardia TaxID=2619320 RepID=UPI00086B8B37|nr:MULTISPECIES: enoyl-CoA hydratase/isomerase family protein [unclassified Pseudonocardia]MBN9109030.1 enoyl-CoA hydratase/isomerase family protein [Pseudonocardia sp.]ODU24207.1 MAG: hypothetical protein ABS80_13205 [Pseudonocardia sp. SCN 72-51]ODV02579.1 MAG: hypothetical protein ABT15_25350 [Pseudonocardia sp. SCN 73-27]
MTPVSLSATGGVATLLVDRRPSETWDLATISALASGLGDAERQGARVAVLAAAGDVFCAGGEIGGPAAGVSVAEHRARYADAFVELDRALRTSAVPVVAKVRGPANAGGLGVVAMCDVVVAGSTASFATPEVRGGMFPLIAMGMLHPHLSPRRAFSLFYGGEPLGPAEAVAAGLATEAVDDADLDDAVARWCDRLLAADPRAVAIGRRAYWAMADAAPGDRAAIGGKALRELISTSDATPDQSYMQRALE